MKIHTIFLLLIVLSISSYQTFALPPKPLGQAVMSISNPDVHANPPGPANTWKLLFSDEFNGTTLDTNKWTTCYWWDKNGCTILTNNELEWYQPKNVKEKNGVLILTAMKENVIGWDGKVFPYTSGMVSSGRNTSDKVFPVRFSFKYGYTEIRAIVPKGKGFWPAFWMLPITQSSKPEIDVMEILGSNTYRTVMNYHFLDSSNKRIDIGDEWISPLDFSKGWHIFGLDWEPDKLIWYVDGIERFRITKTSSIPIPAENMYLIMNLAVGGGTQGKPDETAHFPNSYQIDYVRVYQHFNKSQWQCFQYFEPCQ